MACRLLQGLEEEEEDSHSLPGSGSGSGRDWSSLPVLLLWKIKDRLDFFDDAKLALVCRHWSHASINNPTKKQTVGDGIPWIMLGPSSNATNMCVREFINVETKKKFAVELPEFYGAQPLFSRKGWILFRRRKVFPEPEDNIVDSWIKDSLFLVNPLTKGKIEVGDIDIVVDRERKGCLFIRGCFSTNEDGFPDCVVVSHIESRSKNTISLYITYPAGAGAGAGAEIIWTIQSYAGKGFKVWDRSVTVINGHFYCYGDEGMLIYDMGGQTWKEVAHPLYPSIQPGYHLMEREDGHAGLFFRSYYPERRFFKYSHTHNCWQRYDDAANNRSIFWKLYERSLSVGIQRGVNVYEIRQEYRKAARVYCYDLLAEETRKSPGDNYFTLHHEGVACWVDIG